MGKSRYRAFAAIRTEANIGVAEPLDDSDILLPIRTNYAPNINTSEEAVEELTVDGQLAAPRAGSPSLELQVGHFFRPTQDLAIPPYILPYLKATVFDVLQTFTFGLAAGAAEFAIGERITAPGGKVGRVVLHEVNTITVVEETGNAFANGDTITGADSQARDLATAPTASGWAAIAGQASSTTPGYHATLRLIIDGYQYQMAGGLADLVMTYSPRGSLDMQWTFNAGINAYGDIPHPTPSQYASDMAVPPVWVDANLLIGTFKPTGLGQLTLTCTNNVTESEDAQAINGVGSSDYAREAPQIVTTVDMASQAEFDYVGEFLAQNTHPLRFSFGRELGSGRRIHFLSPGVSIQATPTEGDNNAAKFQLTLGSAGREILWFN